MVSQFLMIFVALSYSILDFIFNTFESLLSIVSFQSLLFQVLHFAQKCLFFNAATLSNFSDLNLFSKIWP